ncbi:cytochrome B [Aliidiomarina sedimenti]|uniref:Cytochrome B n=1 Tax=Aliidiomarina sedimenti TaxID=1933879 RepID=A0ABY0C2M6_9GAMM|nr:cytochrome b/b6 domain-containing protein [Aliidiomarina sedimenti]RUO31903.1 cytochrome B [Aliidiomarina sedimenti]
MTELKSYSVWDPVTRWFHWINVLCVLLLIGVGLVIYNAGALGVSNDGKIMLKVIHVWVGYVFLLNLMVRFIWAFFGNRYARWHAILPGRRGFFSSVRSYVIAFIAGRPENYLGHNPLGRLSVFVLFVLLTIQAITGLVLAGTDLFYPPFGHWIAQWVAVQGVQPDALVPYAPEMYDAQAYASMRNVRSPFIFVHKYNFFVLTFFIILHIAAVIITEVKEGGSLTSAMFTGKKVFNRRPVDDENDRDQRWD